MKRFAKSFAGKTIMILLCMVCFCLFVGGSIAELIVIEENVGFLTEEEFLQDHYRYETYDRTFNYACSQLGEDISDDYGGLDENAYAVQVLDENGKEVLKSDNYGDFKKDSKLTNYEFKLGVIKVDGQTEYGWVSPNNSNVDDFDKIYSLNVIADLSKIQTGFEEQLELKAIHILFTFKNAFVPLAVIGLLGCLALFIILMWAAGRRPDSDEILPNRLTKIPYDILIFLFICLGGIYIAICESISANVLELIFFMVGVGMAGIVGILLCMGLALRLKLHIFWKGTLIYKVCAFCIRMVKLLFGSLPLVWRTAAVILVLSFLEFFGIMITQYDPGDLVILWFLEKLLLIPLIMYLAVSLRKLEKSGEAIAAGDLSYQTDTKGLCWNFKKHGENLNAISKGMSQAVEQRMKSERMKTELITNVSHDIKTPLTSIINYASLIGNEDFENENVKEYAGVLVRQSEKLKRLIEDLVEASKASTGNLDVEMTPCDAAVFVTQAGGEYEEKLKAAGLTLVSEIPDHSVHIRADGRRMWRVFDNLMNNICKYSQPGTRVYLTLEEEGGNAIFTFKNTSRDALNISADELMERFVRGDSSRTQDGNGLGLSIARSLTELQQGSLALSVDGDLFKATLKFPVI